MFEYEFEAEYDREGECEYANEFENEDFIPAALLPVAGSLAMQAIGGLFKKRRRRRKQHEFEFENENEFESNPFAMGEFEAEDEYEFEAASMNESEALMEHLAYKAATSESEAEAEAFVSALVPIATKLAPYAGQALAALAPTLMDGAASIAKSWYNNRETRGMIPLLSNIAQDTVADLAGRASKGQPIDERVALQTLAGKTKKMLSNPEAIAQSNRRSHRSPHRRNARAGRRPDRRNGRQHPAFARH